MSDLPSILERQALGDLAKALTGKNSAAFGDYFIDFFDDWEPIYDSGISYPNYIRTLKIVPLNAKRYIVQSVLKGWNLHKDLPTLYECINLLVFLDICGPAEYYLMQIAYNMISTYGNAFNNLPCIYVESYKNTEYTLRFWKNENPLIGGTYGIVDFKLHREGTKTLLTIIPGNSLLKSYYKIPENINIEGQIEDEVFEDMMNLLGEEFSKEVCPKIYSDWSCDLGMDPFRRTNVLKLHPEYINKNGI